MNLLSLFIQNEVLFHFFNLRTAFFAIHKFEIRFYFYIFSNINLENETDFKYVSSVE